MRVCSVLLTLVPVLFFLAKVDASANATASLTALGAFSSTGNRSGTLISDPFAGDEERVHGIDEFEWGDKFAILAAKIKQALLKQDERSQLELKVAWWRVRNVDPGKVYTNLKLDEDHDNVLLSPWLHLWFKYVKSYNLEHPTKEVSALDVLTDQYGDYKLMMTLEQAKRMENPIVGAIGATLQSEQMEAWWLFGYSPKRLYLFLRSKWNYPHLLSGRAYDVWNIYFTKDNPGRSMSLFDKMFQTFGDKDLSLLLIAANQPQTGTLAPHVAELTTKLQDQLVMFWLDRNVLPQLVFEYLGLNENPDYLLDRREIKVWMWYAERFREKFGAVETLNEVIGSSFTLNKIVIMTKKVLTDDGKKLAQALREEMALKLADPSA